MDEHWTFESRRSPVLGLHGMVATSHPLAAKAGLDVLEKGGNAADAAIATAAALNVVEPTSTGIGGDCFALYYDTKHREVYALNGSGRSGANQSIESMKALGINSFQDRSISTSVHAVTVPGAAMGWFDTLERFGRMEINDVLGPAIRLAEEGVPITPVISKLWKDSINLLKSASPNSSELLLNNSAPAAGEIWKNPNLARVFRELAEGGPEAFYQGASGKAIIEIIKELGGHITSNDLANHVSTFDKPISTQYRGYQIWEHPPNGQGIVALIALNVLEQFEIDKMQRRNPDLLHLLIDTVRLAFRDGLDHVADPSFVDVPVDRLLSAEHASDLKSRLNSSYSIAPNEGPEKTSDTVYLSVVDGDGNACSFINSNYSGFGTGIIPKGCGFTLQNRGSGFSLDEAHPNRLEPSKRPYHTIIPALITHTDTNELFASIGVMGGYHQPQGHVQTMVNLIDFNMNPQAALDEPRFSIYRDPPWGLVSVEDGIPDHTLDELTRRGHKVERSIGASRLGLFGRGQIIIRDRETGVLWGGSDGRGDGAAVTW
ncbi:MAG: gamma-glutamyltransferase [Chloroflexota bacterium]|nr:gamma-glutamyltransferase [Chloroflexota bacterium]